MNQRPVTQENKTEIYKTPRWMGSLYCPNIKDLHELPAGSRVTVFDAQTTNLTGVNETHSAANIAYRIKGILPLTVYEGKTEVLKGNNCQNEKLRKHSNLRPVSAPDWDLSKPLPYKSIVALREGTTYKKKVLPPGALFIILSKPKAKGV
ncbi:hypothetical protein C0995_003854 [Termitomyces sp. Mi166|nr:hypothetical protein C0995_003854 [Termitomyces sp. Mi166\